jgi:hypothetical protein
MHVESRSKLKSGKCVTLHFGIFLLLNVCLLDILELKSKTYIWVTGLLWRTVCMSQINNTTRLNKKTCSRILACCKVLYSISWTDRPQFRQLAVVNAFSVLSFLSLLVNTHHHHQLYLLYDGKVCKGNVIVNHLVLELDAQYGFKWELRKKGH